MIRGPAAYIGLFFIALAAIFLAAALRDQARPKDQRSGGRRTWVRIAIIFAIVGIGLQLVHLLVGS